MLPLYVTGSRIARRMPLGRVLRTKPALHLSTKTISPSKSTSNKSVRYIATASVAVVVATVGIWYSKAARDDVPQVKGLPNNYAVVKSDQSKTEVTRLLSQEAHSVKVKNIAGLKRYDLAQLASNSLCEDRLAHGQFPSPWNDGKSCMAWAVFDGHSGWQTAELLQKQLLPFLRHNLDQLRLASGDVSDALIQRTIMKTFVDFDDSIIKTVLDISQSKQSLWEKMQKLAPAFAGSCALLSLYDPVTSKLHVACTGDSRAVLGQQDAEGKWFAIPLSVDQTGSNEEEIARLNLQHPGEQGIAKDGRVLGLVVSRAFGDGRWKWPTELHNDLNRRFYGPSPLTPRYNVQTPPYITAEPVVTSTSIERGRPSFLILATDGMWDALTSQQAVDLVGTWLGSQTNGKKPSKAEPTYESFDFGDFWKGVTWKFVEERTTTQDENAAVHLMRNTLGGNHHELIAGRLAVSAPLSRKLRDDITVQVVFFNMPEI